MFTHLLRSKLATSAAAAASTAPPSQRAKLAGGGGISSQTSALAPGGAVETNRAPQPRPTAPGGGGGAFYQGLVYGGPRLVEVQRKLNALGFDAGTPDGIWGPHTQGAVRAFQRARGLVVDGIVGPQTLGALRDGGGQEQGSQAASPAAEPRAPAGDSDTPTTATTPAAVSTPVPAPSPSAATPTTSSAAHAPGQAADVEAAPNEIASVPPDVMAEAKRRLEGGQRSGTVTRFGAHYKFDFEEMSCWLTVRSPDTFGSVSYVPLWHLPTQVVAKLNLDDMRGTGEPMGTIPFRDGISYEYSIAPPEGWNIIRRPEGRSYFLPMRGSSEEVVEAKALPVPIRAEVQNRIENRQLNGVIPYQGATYHFSYDSATQVITVTRPGYAVETMTFQPTWL